MKVHSQASLQVPRLALLLGLIGGLYAQIPAPPPPPPEPDTPVLTPPAVRRAQVVEDDEPSPSSPPMNIPKAVPVEDDEPTPAPTAAPTAQEAPKPETKPEEKPEPTPLRRPDPFAEPEGPAIPDALKIEPKTLMSTKTKKDLSSTWKTQVDARTLRLEIPAPRGQIVDRNGRPFARNRVVYYAALNFPWLTPEDPANILAYAKERINATNSALGKSWTMPDDRILQHYKYRRWLPLIFSVENGLNAELTPEEQRKFLPLADKGLMMQPTYLRQYPQGETACHVIGYAGRRQPLPTKEIVEGEPFTEEPAGRAGLELFFEDQLRGQPGSISLLFSPEGELLHDEVLRKPVPGHNVVTTLDYNMQRYAESALRTYATNGGAMVIIDVHDGDILAMASNPGFDLNEYIPGISQERQTQLAEDPKAPLFGRAYQGSYFPASTFKIVTSLAGLESGAITPNTYYDCSGTFTLGKDVFRNWHPEGEGSMNVATAIKRSCNIWFYQAGIETGSSNLIAMAERLGFGQKTGITLPGESKGFVPTDTYYMQRYGHKLHQGILCSISIGQIVECSPLQAAQCMAAVADGTNMPQLRLVSQIQDLNDRVIQAWEPAVRSRVDLSNKARLAVLKGMMGVVNDDDGTGKGAWIKQAKVAGKTGTAQWKIFADEDKNRNLAWFTGFLPAENPKYAFAVVYEGAPGEGVSGGKKAAPIVSKVFNNIYENAKPDDPIMLASNSRRALLVDDEEELTDEVASAPKAEEVQEDSPAQPPPNQRVTTEEQKGVRGLFRRLFRR